MASIVRRTYSWADADGAQRSGQRYQASYVDRAGKRHRKLFKLKRDAQNWLDEQSAGMITGLWVDPRSGRETFGRYADRWLARQVAADSTLEDYERLVRVHLKPDLGGMRMDAVTREDVQKLVRKWSRAGAKPSTIHGRYSKLAIIMKAAVKDRVLPLTPCEDIALPRVASSATLVPITTDVVMAVHKAIDERYQAFVLVAAGTGGRRGEVLGLTQDRVARAFHRVRIDRQLSAKTRAESVVFSPPKTEASVRNVDAADFVFDAIEEHVKTYGVHESGLIFTNAVGKPVSTTTLQAVWSKAAEKVGTDATPHDLRHYFASMQIAGGCSIKKLQALLGHKSATETWDTYGHLVGDEDDRARSIMADTLGAAVKKAGTTTAQEAAAE